MGLLLGYWRERIVQWFAELPLWPTLLALAVITTSLVYGYQTVPSPPADNLRLFLSALATVQATLVGIVFAVTILGIQLTSDRYSARMVTIFYKHPVFVTAAAAFLLSIGLDLGLLFWFPDAANPVFTALLYGSIGMAAGTVVMFGLFIGTVLRLSRPEGILEAYGHRVTPLWYVRQSRQALASDTGPPHPMYEMYTMGLAALEEGDLETARAVISQYGMLVSRTLEGCIAKGVLEELERKEVNYLFEEVLKSQLPDLARHAEEIDESELVSDCLSWQYEIGRQGLETDHGRVLEKAFRGMTQLSAMDAPIEMDYYGLHARVWDYMGELMRDAAERQEYRRLHSLLIGTKRMKNRHLKVHYDPDLHIGMVDGYFEALRLVHSTILHDTQDELAESDFNWNSRGVTGDVKNRVEVETMLYCRKEMCDLSAKIIEVEEKEYYPVTDGTFARNWRETCEHAVFSAPDGYGRTMCQALIEIAYIDPLEFQGHERLWLRRIQDLREKCGDEAVDAAFERIFEFEKLDFVEDERRVFALGVDDWDKRYDNLISVQEYTPLNSDDGFPERLELIQRQSRKQ